MNQMPPVTKNLLIINILCCLATLVAKQNGVDLNDMLGLHFFMADKFMPYQLLTYMFLHGSLEHIFFNIFALWMFGNIIEQVLGSKRFLIYYLVCGLGAGVMQELVQWLHYSYTTSGIESGFIHEFVQWLSNIFMKHANSEPNIEKWNMVGASGAIYGILLAFGMIFPEERLFIFPLPIPIKARLYVVGCAIIELLLAPSNDGVAHYAHLGGMLVGLIILLIWKDNGNGGLLGKIRKWFDRKPRNHFHVYRKN